MNLKNLNNIKKYNYNFEYYILQLYAFTLN